MKLSPRDDVYERIAALLPSEEIRRRFLLHVARVRTLPETDEILLLIEACGYFTLLSAALPERLTEGAETLRRRTDAAQKALEAAGERMQRTLEAMERVAGITFQSELAAREAAGEAAGNGRKTGEDLRVVQEVKGLLGENSLRMRTVEDRLNKIAEFNGGMASGLLGIGAVGGMALAIGILKLMQRL